MSSNPARNRLEHLTASQARGQDSIEQNTDLVVMQSAEAPVSGKLVSIGASETERGSMRAQLAELAGLMRDRAQAVEDRFATLEPLTESLVELTADLDRRATDLESGADELAGRLDRGETAQQMLAEGVDSLRQQADELRGSHRELAGELDSLAGKLERQHARISVHLGEHADQLQDLNSQNQDLQAGIEAERNRVDELASRAEALERAQASLAQHGEQLSGETGAIRTFLKRAGWSLAAAGALVVAGLGSLYWAFDQHGQQMDSLLSDLGLQQQQIAAVEQVTGDLGARVNALPGYIQELFAGLSAEDARLQSDMDAQRRQLESARGDIDATRGELADIQQRLAVPDEVLSLGAYDLGRVPADSWLMERSPGHYTVQIVGVYGRNALANFIGRHRTHLDLDRIAYLETTNKGRDWFVLVQGDYASVAEANDAAEALSPSLQKNSPYVRRFDSIQAHVELRGRPAVQ